MKHLCRILALAIAWAGVSPVCVQGGSIPAAEYRGTIGMYSQTKADIHTEGSIAYDYSYTWPAGGPSTQFIANVQITGDNQLTLDIAGDYRQTGSPPDPKASAYAFLRYYFVIEKKDPNAPETPVPFRISGRGHAQVTYGSTNRTGRVQGALSYRHPDAATSEYLFTIGAQSGVNTNKNVAFEGLRAQPPGRPGMISMYVEGSFYGYGLDAQTGSFQGVIDPYLRIDPTTQSWWMVCLGWPPRCTAWSSVKGLGQEYPSRRLGGWCSGLCVMRLITGDGPLGGDSCASCVQSA